MAQEKDGPLTKFITLCKRQGVGFALEKSISHVGRALGLNSASKFLGRTSYNIRFEPIEFDSNHYYVPAYAKYRPAALAIRSGSYYEPKTHLLVELLLTETPGNLVHAGTFFGDMLPSFSRKCPRVVYAFEPVLENYVLAKLCLQKNKLKNVAIYNSALGESVGISSIVTHDKNLRHLGGASKIAGGEGQITTTITIDSLHIDNLSVIQLDVEGFELPALRGATSTILRNKPAILIEDNNKNCDSFLTSIEYVRVGSIPGINVWTHRQKAEAASHLLDRINAEGHGG